MEFITSPLTVIETLHQQRKEQKQQANKSRSAKSRKGDGEGSGSFREEVENAFRTTLCTGSEPLLSQIPLLSKEALQQGALKPNSLVRFRGMVQDTYDPEYFVGEVEEADIVTGQRRLLNGMYMDTVSMSSADGVTLDWDGDKAVTMERLPLYCIPVPGESAWVKEAQKVGGGNTINAASSSSSSSSTLATKKRGRDNNDGIDAMEDVVNDSTNGGGVGGGGGDGDKVALSHSTMATATTTTTRGGGTADNVAAINSSSGSSNSNKNPYEQELDSVELHCMVKMYTHGGGGGGGGTSQTDEENYYEDFTCKLKGDLKLNDVIEVIGVLSYDDVEAMLPPPPLERPSSSLSSSPLLQMERADETEANNSIVTDASLGGGEQEIMTISVGRCHTSVISNMDTHDDDDTLASYIGHKGSGGCGSDNATSCDSQSSGGVGGVRGGGGGGSGGGNNVNNNSSSNSSTRCKSGGKNKLLEAAGYRSGCNGYSNGCKKASISMMAEGVCGQATGAINAENVERAGENGGGGGIKQRRRDNVGEMTAARSSETVFDLHGVFSDLLEEQFIRKVPPPSLLPRLHCILCRRIAPVEPLQVDTSAPNKALLALQTTPSLSLGAFMAKARKQCVKLLSAALGGDLLAAEYTLLALISRVYCRKGGLTLGSLSVNLTDLSPGGAKALHAVVSSLVLRCKSIPVTVQSLSHEYKFAPKKDYDLNRLMMSELQLATGTVVLLDETPMSAGVLTATGVKNLSALQALSQSQSVPYDFHYYSMDWPVDYPVIVLSTHKAMTEASVQIPLVKKDKRMKVLVDGVQVKEAEEKVEDDVEKAVNLPTLRVYLAACRHLPFSMDSSASRHAEEDYVRARQTDSTVQSDDFHLWLTLARLHSLSIGQEVLTGEVWYYMREMESKRRDRMKTGTTATRPSLSSSCLPSPSPTPSPKA